MDTLTNHSRVLMAVIQKLLRPIIRVLLRNGVAYDLFAELAKRSYVDVAMTEFYLPNRKQTISRVSVLTGLTRKEVQRVSSLPPAEEAGIAEHYNRAARVVAGWVRDAEFAAAEAEPAALPAEGDKGSFSALVRRYSGDVPARAVLDELLRVGAVEQLGDGRIRLLSRVYIPHTSDLDKLHILSTDVADLIYTIDHNLQQDAGIPRFQRKVMYDNLPAESLEKIRSMSREQSQKLLERLDRLLAQHDRDTNPSAQGTGRIRAGVGIYYFEENLGKPPEGR
jgi:hypothetical protein